VESPLTIAVAGEVVATTMRTPGHDLDLTAGWLVSEAGLRGAGDILDMKALAASARDDDEDDANDDHESSEIDTVQVRLAPGIQPPRPRAYVTSSSCGVCSADVIDAAPVPYAPLHSTGWRLVPSQALELIEQMRSRQKMFDLTGALHAAALVGPESEVLYVREDVGRHNAVDKVIGWRLREGDTRGVILMVSGRVSFEIVQKALRAGLPVVAAISAPTSLAVDLAIESHMTLVGFVRGAAMSVYAGASRLGVGVDAPALQGSTGRVIEVGG